LREKLDEAGAEDGTHYMLTIASPSSGYLLRGQEVMDAAKYWDYVNIMTYDLHGAWNSFVGPNAALFDNGDDSELKYWDAYQSVFGGIGYLNTDWAFHYFRGSMPAGRINIGVPFYSRGWQGVEGGTNGLWGEGTFPNQSNCQPGTGSTADCGNGAMGINNLWHDDDAVTGEEVGAGASPMWHNMNLAEGIFGDYLGYYDIVEEDFVGTYERHYSEEMVAPWLWNSETKVFLSTEDTESIATKAQYVIDRGIGGIMFWEMAGDYGWNEGKQQYEIGSDMTSLMSDMFDTAAPYGNTVAEFEMPTHQIDVSVAFVDFALGDNNYPITPTVLFTNNSEVEIPGGTEFFFDMGTTTPAGNVGGQGGGTISVVTDGGNSGGGNVGGLQNNFHRFKLVLPGFDSIAPNGGTHEFTIKYYLPISMPSNWVMKFGDQELALKMEHPFKPSVDLSQLNACPDNIDVASLTEAPNWLQLDWQGNPSNAGNGDYYTYQGDVWMSKGWTTSLPADTGQWGTWQKICSLPVE
jgi:chitinase